MAKSKSSKIASQISRVTTSRILEETKKARKAFIGLGMKSKIPNTLSEYTKNYTGTKKFARDDYVFEMVAEMEKFYNKVGKKVEKKRPQLEEFGFNPSTRTKMKKLEGNSSIQTIKTITRDIVTLSNIAHPDYLRGDITKKELNMIIPKEKGKTPKFNSVNVAGKKHATLKTFGGSQIILAYNNFLIGLSDLGYTKTLQQVLSISPMQWATIFNQHADDLDLVYKYSQFHGSGDDDIFCEWFGGEKAEDTGIEDEDMWDI
jgi:hypothetical protein